MDKLPCATTNYNFSQKTALLTNALKYLVNCEEELQVINIVIISK